MIEQLILFGIIIVVVCTTIVTMFLRKKIKLTCSHNYMKAKCSNCHHTSREVSGIFSPGAYSEMRKLLNETEVL